MAPHKYPRSRSRSRSPERHGHRDVNRPSRRHDEERRKSQKLPYSARELTKHDLPLYKPMFALYLDIQKRIDLEDLSADEIRGRWKSFMNKWNHGDLAEGWYDPSTLTKAQKAVEDNEPKQRVGATSEQKPAQKDDLGAEDEDEDDYGPTLPGQIANVEPTGGGGPHAGPTIPRLDDLKSRNEDVRLDLDQAREQRLEAMRQERQLERKVQKDRLDDLVPRAVPGTRERQMEKKQDLAASNRAFAASKDAGDADIPESDVMGGDDLGELKRMRKEQERRKTDREIKREEILRAKAAEREERTARMRAKEEKTMSMLRELARSRFGDGNMQSATLGEDY